MGCFKRELKRENGPLLFGGEKHKEETRKQNIHGVVPGFLGGKLFMCFSPPQGMTRQKKTYINKFLAPTQSETITQICLCLCVFSFPEVRQSGKRPTKGRKQPIKEGKRPLRLIGCFQVHCHCGKWPSKRPIKRSIIISDLEACRARHDCNFRSQYCPSLFRSLHNQDVELCHGDSR